MILRRALLVSLVLLSACAVNPEGWEATPSRYPLMERYVQLPYWSAMSLCGGSPACAQRDYKAQECRIYYGGAVLEDWVREHELKHCKGYDHAPYPIVATFH